MFVIFNWLGLGMCAVAFAIAFAVGHLLGTSSEGILMTIAGPILLAADLTYRMKLRDKQWFAPSGGGSLFFLPAWGFGIVWTVLGAVYAVRGAS